MTNLQKVVCEWTGFAGAPAYSVFYRGPADITTSRIRTFYNAVKDYLPQQVSVQVPNAGDLVDEATGELSGSWSTTANAVVTGSTLGVYSAPTGCVVRWTTAGIANGRRVRGRTFLVPLLGSAFENNGTINATALGTISSAAYALWSGETGNLGVWHRPIAGAGGSFHPVTGSDTPDRAAVLRSRRD